MWYVLKSEKGAKIYTGFKDGVTREMYEEAIIEGNIAALLNVEIAEAGDTFFTPAGRIHAIGAGIVLVEIQQTSDLTYRISDWNRKSSGETTRELHTELALEAISLSETGKNKIRKKQELNQTENLVNCEFFNTNILHFNTTINKDYYLNDSFILYICIEGEFFINSNGSSEKVLKGETVVLPAVIKGVSLKPVGEARLMEIFINS